MTTRSTSAAEILKQYFGYDHFRPLQAEIIESVLAGNDGLVLMPTGGGKSVCFQVPTMVLSGITIVISPLIALMKDQVQSLVANGIAAAFVNSSIDAEETYLIEQKALTGQLKLLYISPEKLFSNNYLNFLKQLNITLFAVDEAHCVSTWGHDFRPEYTKLKILKTTFPNVPLLALTATADRVTRKDVLTQLAIPEAQVYISSFDRPNLSLAVLPGRGRLRVMADFIIKRPNQPGIIYCLSRKNTEEVADALRRSGINALHFHAGMDTITRSKVQDKFIKDDIQVIVATIAFGMGIDKSNVRWIIHYSLPSNVESFYQEIGRAGRDGVKADTLLFYTYADLIVRQDMIKKSELPAEMKEVQQAKLDRMTQYANAEICRRRILLSYFNEEVTKDCGNCDVCKNPPVRIEATILAQKVLSVIHRTKQKVAMGMLIDILRGSNNKKIIENEYHKLKTFGAGRDLKMEEWADYIQQMLNSGVMDIAYDEGHAYKLNNRSNAILFENAKVQLVRFEAYSDKIARKAEEELPFAKSKKEIVKDALFERLRTLRKELADEKDIPAFVVFSDATLSDMAQKKPINKAQMLTVSGMGIQKFTQYGARFITEIIDFSRENGTKATGLTYIETFELYKKGLSPAEIAQARGMNEATIYSHLAKLYEEGEPIDLKKYIGQEAVNEIVNAAKLTGTQKGDALKPLYFTLEEKYSYGLIRLALALN